MDPPNSSRNWHEGSQCDGNPTPCVLTRGGHFMCEGKIGFAGHDENGAISRWKIYRLGFAFGRARAQPEYSVLPKRNGDDGSAGHHFFCAITVASDVMAKSAVIPIQENAIQLRLDGPTRPTEERFKNNW